MTLKRANLRLNKQVTIKLAKLKTAQIARQKTVRQNGQAKAHFSRSISTVFTVLADRFLTSGSGTGLLP